MLILLPLGVFLVEAFSLGMFQVMTVSNAVHAVDRLGVHSQPGLPVAPSSAAVPPARALPGSPLWRDPDPNQ